MAERQYRIDGKLVREGILPDASDLAFEKIRNVAGHNFESPFGNPRAIPRSRRPSTSRNTTVVTHLYDYLAANRRRILARHVNHAEGKNDGYRPWLARFSTYKTGESGDLDYDASDESILRPEVDDAILPFQVLSDPNGNEEVPLEIQRHANLLTNQYDYFIIKEKSIRLTINGHAVPEGSDIAGPLPDFSIVEIDRNVVFWWRTKKAFVGPEAAKREAEEMTSAGDVKQPPKKWQKLSADIREHLEALQSKRNVYKRAILKQKPVKTEPTPSPEPTHDITVPEAQPYDLYQSAEVDDRSWSAAFEFSLSNCERMGPQEPKYGAKDRIPRELSSHSSLDFNDDIYLAVASLYLPLSQSNGRNPASASIQMVNTSEKEGAPSKGYSSFVVSNGDDTLIVTVVGLKSVTNGTSSEDDAHVALLVAHRTHKRRDGKEAVELSVYDSGRQLHCLEKLNEAARDAISYSDWLPNIETLSLPKAPREVPVVQQQDLGNDGIHAILNAWAHLIGINVKRPSTRVGLDQAQATYEKARRLVTLALRGALSVETIELFLYAYGFAAQPSTYEEWLSQRSRETSHSHAHKYVSTDLVNDDVNTSFAGHVANLQAADHNNTGTQKLPTADPPPADPPRAPSPERVPDEHLSRWRREFENSLARPKDPNRLDPHHTDSLRLRSFADLSHDDVIVAIGSLWATLLQSETSAKYSYSDFLGFYFMQQGELQQDRTYAVDSDEFIIPIIVGNSGEYVRAPHDVDLDATEAWNFHWGYRQPPSSLSGPTEPGTQQRLTRAGGEGREVGGIGHLVLAVAQKVTGQRHNVNISIYDSLRNSRTDLEEMHICARNVVRSSAWLGNVTPIFNEPEHHYTTTQTSGANTCGVHVILNAWTIMLNLTPQPIQEGRRVAHADNYAALRLINQALRGCVDTYTIRAFLIGHGIARAARFRPRVQDASDPQQALDDLQTYFMSEQILRHHVARILQQMRHERRNRPQTPPGSHGRPPGTPPGSNHDQRDSEYSDPSSDDDDRGGGGIEDRPKTINGPCHPDKQGERGEGGHNAAPGASNTENAPEQHQRILDPWMDKSFFELWIDAISEPLLPGFANESDSGHQLESRNSLTFHEALLSIASLMIPDRQKDMRVPLGWLDEVSKEEHDPNLKDRTVLIPLRIHLDNARSTTHMTLVLVFIQSGSYHIRIYETPGSQAFRGTIVKTVKDHFLPNAGENASLKITYRSIPRQTRDGPTLYPIHTVIYAWAQRLSPKSVPETQALNFDIKEHVDGIGLRLCRLAIEGRLRAVTIMHYLLAFGYISKDEESMKALKDFREEEEPFGTILMNDRLMFMGLGIPSPSK